MSYMQILLWATTHTKICVTCETVPYCSVTKLAYLLYPVVAAQQLCNQERRYEVGKGGRSRPIIF